MVNRFAVSAALLALSGCGWKSDGLSRLEQLYPTVTADAGGTGTLDLGNPQCAGLTGAWAVELVEHGTIAPLAEPWRITLTDLFIATSGASFQMRFCNEVVAITTSTGPTTLGKTEIPQPLKDALAASPVVVPLPGNGSFQASNVIWLWGLRNLANPLTDPLPIDASDSHVWDQDMDGNPGATITILSPSGNQYLVRRAAWSFDPGRLTLDNAWITGALTPVVDSHVLGASNSLLNTSPPIISDATGSTYAMRCVGTTYTCDSLSHDYVALFQQAP